MRTLRAASASAAVIACLVASVTPAAAQQYPTKPIRVIIPFAVGGQLDPLVRLVAPPVGEFLGQPLVVENRAGGSTIIGMTACAKAAPDGYTVCVTTADSLSFNPAIFSNLPYDPDADFAPVINLGFSNGSLVASAKAPFNTYKEAVAYSKAKPGSINWATWGPGSRPDIFLQWIKRHEKIDVVAIAYKGAGGGNPAVLSGEADITYMGIGLASQHVKAGKLKALVLLTNKHSSYLSNYLPGVPLLSEVGSDPDLRPYFPVFAPAQTPRPIIDRLNAEFAKAVRLPKTQEFFRANAWEVVDNTAVQFAEFAKKDRENAARVMRSIGIVPTAAPSN
jgi:tripartite-type tricarboxylate transporter receptor subunit TctC